MIECTWAGTGTTVTDIGQFVSSVPLAPYTAFPDSEGIHGDACFTKEILQGIIKENQVEIGGNKCHLCGAGRRLTDESSTITYKKSGRYEREWVYYVSYRCGTMVTKRNLSKRDTSDQPVKDTSGDPEVVLGEKCIK